MDKQINKINNLINKQNGEMNFDKKKKLHDKCLLKINETKNELNEYKKILNDSNYDDSNNDGSNEMSLDEIINLIDNFNNDKNINESLNNYISCRHSLDIIKSKFFS